MQSLMSVLNVTGVSWVCSALSVYDEVTSRWFTLGPQLNPRLSLRVELVTHGTSSVVTSCLRQSTRSWTLKSQQLLKAADLLFVSFTQWCKSLKSLDFVAVPQSLSVRSMVSQWHLEQDENLVLLCAAVWGNSGTPREWGSKSSSWDRGVCNLPTQAPSSAARSAWVCLVTWRGWSVFSLADFVASILSVMSCMADLVTCLPWKYEWFEMWKCRDWDSAEGLALLITLLRPGW